MTLKEQFLSKVMWIPFHECWEWGRSIGNHGYGFCYDKKVGKVTVAHRISYELHFGKIPKGLCVLHKCDNRSCVNPKHLFLGTAKDNALDKINKGRNHEVKITHCPHGHLLSQDNLCSYELRTKGWRICKTCARKRVSVYQKKPASKLKRARYKARMKSLKPARHA